MIYDLIVLGGGPAGYLGAQRAAENGMKVLLFEKRKLGGVCLNEGCIPTKTLLNSAKNYDHAKNGNQFGVTVENVSLDLLTVYARKKKVVNSLVSGITMTLKKNKVDIINKKASIIGKQNNSFLIESGNETYRATKLLIATGSQAIIPPIPGLKKSLEKGFTVTSKELLDEENKPENLLVVGGGVVGLEMAFYYNTIGSKVTIIEMRDKIAGPIDTKASNLLQRQLKKKGIDFMLKCKVTSFIDDGVTFEKNGESHFITADKILLSIGRQAASDGCGLECIGVKVEKGKINTDSHMRTNVPGVWAAGDVDGKMMLAHVAYRESEVAVNDMQDIEDSMYYDAVPSVIYTAPELATVGLSEEEAAYQEIEYQSIEVSAMYSGRFVAENNGEKGCCRIIVDKNTKIILGATMVMPYASEMIWGFSEAINEKLTLKDLKKVVFPHPTVSEVIREAIFSCN